MLRFKRGDKMYYKNLRAEMVRNGISKHDVQKTLEISNNTYYEKMNGRTEFKLSEVEKILALLYRKSGKVYSVEYLFDTTITNGLKKSKYIGETAHQKSPDTSQILSESTSGTENVMNSRGNNDE
jgi:hypothetical protein